jgi:hypothetical protein
VLSFLNAHGFDPGPTQRPLLAGTVTGLIAAVPAAISFSAFCTFPVLADEVLQQPRVIAAIGLFLAFGLAGAIYGALFRRGANDLHGGWLFGLAYGLLLWIVAPVIVLPFVPGMGMTAGQAAIGFLVSFLTWGLFLGALFPRVHRPLHADLDGSNSLLDRLGSSAAAIRKR